jgi:hypothetical protein
MASEEQDKERGFTIVDRRGDDEGPASDSESKTSEQRDPASPDLAGAERRAEGPRPDLPAIDFATFVLSLATSALDYMGLIDDPETGQPGEKNLALARQTIDTLTMLSEKTRGNLDEQEAHLMESMLYELRMRFVEAGR